MEDIFKPRNEQQLPTHRIEFICTGRRSVSTPVWCDNDELVIETAKSDKESARLFSPGTVRVLKYYWDDYYKLREIYSKKI